MGNKHKEILKLVKVRFIERAVAFVYAAIIGSLVASKGILNPIYLAYAFLISFSIMTAIYVYNDVMDYEFDKINKVDRPIASGSVTRREGLNLETLIVSSVLLLLGLLYSTPPIRFRNRFLMVNIVRAMGGFLSCLLGGAIIGNISIQVVYQGFMFFMLIFAGAPVFDLPDLEGDKAGMSKSISILYGPKTGIKFSIVGWSAAILITALAYPYIGFNIITPIMLTSLLLIHIWLAYSLLSRWQDINYCRETCKKIIHLGLLYQLSFLLGVYYR
ncbi:MAG: UbiA family prenyltransferase [Candidatus Bathyarchaeia archaeon]